MIFLRDVDVVVHLAGISNDPIGNKFEAATRAINTDGTIRLINKAQKHEIKNFVLPQAVQFMALRVVTRVQKRMS